MTAWFSLAAVSAGTLLLAWVAYPWVMIRLGERRPAMAAALPDPTRPVSVVIATREPPAAVRARLVDLLEGQWPAERLECIIAVDGDPARYRLDGLPRRPGRLEIVGASAPGGKACALNAGVAAATCEMVVFADTAQRFAPDAIPHLVAALGDPSRGAVSGALRIGNDAQDESPIVQYWRMERRLRAAEARVHSAVGLSGSIYAMRRALWKPLPAGLILDDLWIPMRLVLEGHRVGYDSRAEASDTRSTTHDQEFARKVRTLTGNLQLVLWMPVLLLPWRNPIWVQFFCHKLLRLATPFALLLFGIGALGAAFQGSQTLGWVLVGTTVGVALLVGAVPGRLGRRARQGMLWGLSMQGAIIAATWNGMRGRWDVWKPAPLEDDSATP